MAVDVALWRFRRLRTSSTRRGRCSGGGCATTRKRLSAGRSSFLLAVAITAPVIAPKDPTDGELADSLASPGQEYLLGADKNGREIPQPLIYGTRTALGGALMIVIISEVIGVPIGIWAAYRGGWVDETITRVWDMLLAFPPLLLAFAVVAAFGPGLPKAALALGILYVPFIALASCAA